MKKSSDIVGRLDADAEACDQMVNLGAAEWQITAVNLRAAIELIKAYRLNHGRRRPPWDCNG